MRIKSILLGLAAAIATTSPVLASNMTDAQIEDKFIGMRLVSYQQGIESMVLYDEDGFVRISGSSLAGEGTWTVTDGSFCTNMTSGPLLGQSCMTIQSRLDGGFAMSNGVTFQPGQ